MRHILLRITQVPVGRRATGFLLVAICLATRAPVAHMGNLDVITELLSRGPQVRVLPGAPFPKDFADSDRREIFRRMQIEKSDRSREFAQQLADAIFLKVSVNSKVTTER